MQFVRDEQAGRDYAIKFFTLRANFEREAALYANPALRSMMPAVCTVVPNSDEQVCIWTLCGVSDACSLCA